MGRADHNRLIRSTRGGRRRRRGSARNHPRTKDSADAAAARPSGPNPSRHQRSSGAHRAWADGRPCRTEGFRCFAVGLASRCADSMWTGRLSCVRYASLEAVRDCRRIDLSIAQLSGQHRVGAYPRWPAPGIPDGQDPVKGFSTKADEGIGSVTAASDSLAQGIQAIMERAHGAGHRRAHLRGIDCRLHRPTLD